MNAKEKVDQIINGLSPEQLEQLATLLQAQSPGVQPSITVQLHKDVVVLFESLKDSDWFVHAIKSYKEKRFTPYKFTASIHKPTTAVEFKKYVELTRYINYGKGPIYDSLKSAICQLIGIDDEQEYVIADTVSGSVTWSVSKLGTGIAWIGEVILNSGQWLQDNSASIGSATGKPIRVATDWVDGFKVKVNQAINEAAAKRVQ